MSNVETWKTIGLQILQVHGEECGDGSCGCGCGDPFASVKIPEKAPQSEECCEPVCGPETCG
ncbi:MAG: hypothetical protein HYV92_14380 [Candidatus Rokubacteria bacterium]|nr:hypothetical protein [Candidatus Rokubacteria bacterium]MBI2555572.1 hypothetical protein [Candidatus Rokubacteria bacterium]